MLLGWPQTNSNSVHRMVWERTGYVLLEHLFVHKSAVFVLASGIFAMKVAISLSDVE